MSGQYEPRQLPDFAIPETGGFRPRPRPYAAAPIPEPAPQLPRPAMLTLSLVVIVTGSLLLMTGLAFVWIFVYVARDSFGYTGAQGSVYHMLEQFHLRMLGGLAVVGFGGPGAAVVLSFFLLLRKPWPRIAISLLGAVSIVAAAVLLSDSITWVLPAAGYIAFACVILWTPGVSAWCTSHETGEVAPRTMSG